jgi:hypothetical protein
VRKGVALFDENLVTDASASGIEIDAMVPGEFFDRSIFGQVL